MRNSTRKIDTDADFGGYNADNFCHVGAAVVGGSLISGIMGSNAAQSAANTQAGAANAASQAQLQATRESNAQQLEMWKQAQANQSPYMQAGTSALSTLQSGLAPGGQFTQNFKPSDLTTDPSYQWRLNQGTQNLNASAAARGLLGSGQNLKDITDYGQGAASQEYQNAFNRYQTQQTNLYNRISGLASLGQNAAAGVGNAGIQTGANMANTTMAGVGASNNYLTSGAAASAAGQMGAANAIGGGIGNAANGWMGVQYMNKYTGADTPTPTNMAGFQSASTPWSNTPSSGALGSGTYNL